MDDVVLYGPHWSAYTRTVRLALIEKGVDYQLREVDFLSGEMPPEQVKRHPFAKVPALQHGDFQLFETAAICRYVDAAFPGPALQPADAKLLGRMAQIIGILDTYLSEPARMGFTSELLVKPLMGYSPDIKKARDAESEILRAFEALNNCIESGDYLAGDTVSLADLHAVPMIDYIAQTPGGDALIDRHPILNMWWSAIKGRPSVVQTQPDLSVFRTAER